MIRVEIAALAGVLCLAFTGWFEILRMCSCATEMLSGRFFLY
jgi:hypothetical protein